MMNIMFIIEPILFLIFSIFAYYIFILMFTLQPLFPKKEYQKNRDDYFYQPGKAYISYKEYYELMKNNKKSL